MPKAELAKADDGFTCGYCGTKFSTERTLMAHMCDMKQRHMTRDEKHVKLGFWVYCKFWEMNYRHVKQRTYEQFCTSSFFIAFTKFARYILDINAISPNAFVEFLLKSGLPIDKWHHAAVYETYVRELNKKESPSAALERNFLLMQQWALETGEPWTEFFRKVAPAQATSWIRSGRISPWVLYLAPGAHDLYARLSPEQTELIYTALDPEFWSLKLEQHAEDVDMIREELIAAGI